MTRRKKTDGERIAEKTARSPHEKWGMVFEANLAAEIDRLVRRRMAEAWDKGCEQWFRYGALASNPYRSKKKEDTT